VITWATIAAAFILGFALGSTLVIRFLMPRHCFRATCRLLEAGILKWGPEADKVDVWEELNR
jgi:hypothetical protein